jgi:hypothetical protein
VVQLKTILLRAVVPTLLVCSAGVAMAANCGDDVNGKRVACSCGDTVVSDTRLVSTDPVVTERCSDDGLSLRAVGQIESLTLDIAGLQLTGQGNGTGIHVLDGGSAGAILIGGRDGHPGQVAGFRVGISGRGSRAVLAIENLIVVGNETDGIQLSGRAASLSGVVTDDNGRSGIRVHGRDHVLDGVSAKGNRRYDLRVSGNGHYIDTDARTLESDAARITGSGNLVAPTAEVSR